MGVVRFWNKDSMETKISVSLHPPRRGMWFGLMNSWETFAVKSMQKGGWYKHKQIINDNSIFESGVYV